MSKRVTDFTALSAGDVSGTELLYVIDPGLSPADRKMTLTVLQTWLATQNWSFSGSIALTGALTLTGLTVTTNGITVTGNSTITGALTGVTTLTTSGAINGQTISSAASFTGTLAVSGTTALSNTLSVTSASFDGVTITRSDAGASSALRLQEGNGGFVRLSCDGGTNTLSIRPAGSTTFTLSTTEATFATTVAVTNNTATGNGLLVQADSVTTGNVAKFVSNNGGAFTGTVVSVINDFNNAQTATALYVRQDDDGKGIDLSMTRFGVGLTITSPSSAATAISTLGGGSVSFSGTLAVSGAVSMTGNVGELSLGNTTSGSYSFMRLYTGSSHKSWQIAVQNTLNNGFEIAASTTDGGVSFSTPVFTITSAGAARMSGYGAGAATFDASGNITSVSDERQKTDIVPFTAGLAELRGIVPIAHKFSVESGLDTEHTYIGFSAQNVREHLPEVVFEHAETGTLSLWDRGLLAATVNAVKSLDERVSALEVA